MRGHLRIIEARLAGLALARIDVEVMAARFDRPRWQPPGVEWHGEVAVGRIEILTNESAALLDLRFCRGLPVLVLAPSYDEGWPVAQRIVDVEPASINFCAPDMAVRMANGRMDVWTL